MISTERIICRHPQLGTISRDVDEKHYVIWSIRDTYGYGGFKSVTEAYKALKRRRIGKDALKEEK